MNISKSIINFSKRRNIDIEILELDGVNQVWFSQIDKNGEVYSEPLFTMFNNQNDLTWKGNIYLPIEIKEELPATISSERKLKEVIKFLEKELAHVCI
ncbi:hypothetical protein [Photorhabdus namnaonensis]|uniref:Uncharacterized protein n=1 Tax=Photorhabdus namnaonensis TaxID=1851568 RepID=A0A1B8YJ91_9GAMM|nr:hypothetical protein [Photorhabdus namnaonensis]OCA55167.1 hypothetical protein Phpb_01785 [Photorhabdus namnaonensis]